jgi:transcriptional regulator with XRE-family HTH domain
LRRESAPSLETWTNRAEIKAFLSSRRAKITPQQAGLSAYARNRRVPGLRRSEVADLAGVSVEYYAQLERGDLSGVSDSVLEALARALRLTRPNTRTCSTSPAPPAPLAGLAAGLPPSK